MLVYTSTLTHSPHQLCTTSGLFPSSSSRSSWPQSTSPLTKWQAPGSLPPWHPWPTCQHQPWTPAPTPLPHSPENLLSLSGDTTKTWAITLPGDDDWPNSPTSSCANYSYTFTVYTTTVYTVTACPTAVTNCPVGQITTNTITSTTVICPASSGSASASASASAGVAAITSSYQNIALTTSCLTTSYTTAPYSASGNATLGVSKPTGTKSVMLTFTAADNMLGASLSLAAAVAFVVAAL